MEPDELIGKYDAEKLCRFRYRGCEWVLPQVLVFSNNGRDIAPGRVRVVPDPDQPVYEPCSDLRATVAFLAGKHTRATGPASGADEETLRLSGLALRGRTLTLAVAKSRYHDYLGTNYSMDIPVDATGRTLRQALHPGAELCPLAMSRLANHMGMGALVFTSDGFLVVPQRSARVNIHRLQYGPSISGAYLYSDFEIAPASTLCTGLFREGMEELGLGSADLPMSGIRLLAITRELYRGGKPEVFFSATIAKTAQEVRAGYIKATDRGESRSLEFIPFPSSLLNPAGPGSIYIDSHLADVTGFLAAKGKRVSLPLLTNLLLWLEYRISTPRTFSRNLS